MIKPVGAIIHGPMMQPEVFWSFMGLANVGLQFIPVPYSPRQDMMRNVAARRFLDTDATHLIYFDDRHIYPPDIVHKFAEAMVNYDIDVIGSRTYQLEPPFDKAYHPTEGAVVPHTDVMPVTKMYPAATMISRKVIETLSWPLFYYEGGKVDVDMNDIFCFRASVNGHKSYVHMQVETPGLGIMQINSNTREQYTKQHGIKTWYNEGKETSDPSEI